MISFTAVSLALALTQSPAEAPPAAPATATESAPVLTLDEALRLAGERNLDLKAAEARLRQADELSWKAWSGYLPQLTVTGTYTVNQFETSISLPSGYYIRENTTADPGTGSFELPPPGSVSGLPGAGTPYFLVPSGFEEAVLQKKQQLAAQVELNQAILAPQLWFLTRNAQRGERIAALGVEGVRREVLFGVAQAYYGVASLWRARDVSERLLEIASRQEKDARVRFQAGTIAKVGLLRAEIDRARAEQDLRRARNSYESARIALATLLDRPVDFRVADPPEPALPPDASGLEERATRERTDVQAARLQVDVARGGRSAAAARYLPNVGAFGRWQISNSGGFTGENDQWAVGLGLQWTILDGGLRESDIREGSARIAEAEASLASTTAKARQEVRQALLDLESARANAIKAREQRELAAENQRLVDVAYRAGAATAIEQADATAQLRTAEIAATAEALGAQLAALRVLKVVGLSLR